MDVSKSERIRQLISYYAGGNKRKFAKILGVSPQLINTWIARDTLNYDVVFAKCEYINPLWLLSGEGNMIMDNTSSMNGGDDNNTDNTSSIGIIIEQAKEIGRLQERIEVLQSEIDELNSELSQRRSGNSATDATSEASVLVG